MSEEKEKKPNEPQQAEEAKEKDSELQALVNRLKQENEELKKKADGYQKQFEEADKEKIPGRTNTMKPMRTGPTPGSRLRKKTKTSKNTLRNP